MTEMPFFCVLFCFSLYFYFFFNMKFIVTLVSIKHPVLIPTGALLNAHHPHSPPSHPPSTLSLFSVFKGSYGLPPSLSNFFFPFPPPWSSVQFLRIHILISGHNSALSKLPNFLSICICTCRME